jgi:hypothetical protein
MKRSRLFEVTFEKVETITVKSRSKALSVVSEDPQRKHHEIEGETLSEAALPDAAAEVSDPVSETNEDPGAERNGS